MYLRARYYAPTSGRFLSRDTWGGNYDNPITLNKWLYGNANPVLIIDPNGHFPYNPYNIKPNDFARRNISSTLGKIFYLSDDCPSPQILFQNRRFFSTSVSGLVTFDDDGTRSWQNNEKVVVEQQARDVAGAYARTINAINYLLWRIGDSRLYQVISPKTAFYLVHGGPIRFTRWSAEYWGRTHSKNHITFGDALFTNGTTSTNYLSQYPRLVTHEIGHAFESSMVKALRKLGRTEITESLWWRDYENLEGDETGGFAGERGDWQWSGDEGPYDDQDTADRCDDTDGRGEIFADMFVGWAYNQWARKPGTSRWTTKGQERADFMSDHMPDWIFDMLQVYRWQFLIGKPIE